MDARSARSARSAKSEEGVEDKGDEEAETKSGKSVDEEVPNKQQQLLNFRPAVRVRIAKDLPPSIFFQTTGSRKSLMHSSATAQASLLALQEQAMLTKALPKLEQSPPRVEREEAKWKAGRRNAPVLTDHTNSSARKYGAWYLPVEKWQSEERAASWAKKKRGKEPPKTPVPEALPERKIDVDVYSSKAYKAYILRTGRRVPYYLEKIEALEVETEEVDEPDPHGKPISGTVREERKSRRSLPSITMEKALHAVVSEKTITRGSRKSILLPPIRSEKSCNF